MRIVLIVFVAISIDSNQLSVVFLILQLVLDVPVPSCLPYLYQPKNPRSRYFVHNLNIIFDNIKLGRIVWSLQLAKRIKRTLCRVIFAVVHLEGTQLVVVPKQL